MIKLDRTGERYLTNEGYWITITKYFSKRNCTLEFEDGTVIKDRDFSSIKKGSVRKPSSKVGERFITKQGYEAEIIEWFNTNKCTVKFVNTEEVVKNVAYIQITTRSIKRPKDSRIGEKYITTEGCEIEIVEYFNSGNVTIQFKDGLRVSNRHYLDVQQGGIKNPNNPSIYGIGYAGVGKYSPKKYFKCYSLWRAVVRRGYSEKHKERNPSYSGCLVAEEWHNFQKFAEWYLINNNPKIMIGWELDKDILVKGNKIYSPETCEIVPKQINLLFVKNNKSRGILPVGVKKRGKKFQATISKYNTSIDLGLFDTPEEAFKAYKIAKEIHIKEVANEYRGRISDRCYQALINYQVEITD